MTSLTQKLVTFALFLIVFGTGVSAINTATNTVTAAIDQVPWRFDTSKDKCVATSTGTYTVTGGAGAFADATGSGTINTQFNLCTSTAMGTYTGTISQPNSN